MRPARWCRGNTAACGLDTEPLSGADGAVRHAWRTTVKMVNIRVEGERDIQKKVMTTLFALFAEVERDLISELRP